MRECRGVSFITHGFAANRISILDKKCFCCTNSPLWFSCAIWLCSHLYIYIASNVALVTIWKRIAVASRNDYYSRYQHMTQCDNYGTNKQWRCDLTSVTNHGCFFQIFKCQQVRRFISLLQLLEKVLLNACRKYNWVRIGCTLSIQKVKMSLLQVVE